MNNKEKLTKIFKLVFSTDEQVDEQVEEVFNTIAVGEFYMVDGEVAPAGEYVLEDGRTVVVGDEGVITEVLEVTEVELEEDGVELAEDLATEVVDVVEDIVEEADVVNQLMDIIIELERKIAELSGNVEAVEEAMSKLSVEPAEKEMKISKGGFSTPNVDKKTIDIFRTLRNNK